jgi:hypothetical protein
MLRKYGMLILLVLMPIFCAESLYGESLTVDSLSAAKHSHLWRNYVIGNAVFGTGAYLYFANTWGAPNGKFHIKNEFHDNIALTDEVSHFYGGYKLTDGFAWLFRILKVPPGKIDRLAALQAALVTTFIEFPIDSYNPSQGMGLTDLAADYAGIGWGLLKRKHPNNFDMKFCVKQPPWKFKHKFLASTDAEFDNFIWWGVWKPKYLWTGLGYSTNHNVPTVKPEFYLGVGTTMYDLIHILSPRVADEVKSLDTYFISIRVRL